VELIGLVDIVFNVDDEVTPLPPGSVVLTEMAPLVAEDVTKKGPTTFTLNTKPTPMIAPVSGSKMSKKVGTKLRKIAPLNKLKLLPLGINIPPVPPVTSCSVP